MRGSGLAHYPLCLVPTLGSLLKHKCHCYQHSQNDVMLVFTDYEFSTSIKVAVTHMIVFDLMIASF